MTLSRYIFILVAVVAASRQSEGDAVAAWTSITARRFFELPADEQKSALHAAVKQRIGIFDNVAYATDTLVFNPTVDLSSFPYDGPIAAPATDTVLTYTYLSSRLHGSYLTETHRERRDRRSPGDSTVNRYDAEKGEFLGTNTRHDRRDVTQGAVDTVQDIVDKEDRFAYWGRGGSDPRGCFFLDECLRVLDVEVLTSPSRHIGESATSVSEGRIDQAATVVLSFRSVLPGQAGRDGLLSVWPAPPFLIQVL